MESPHLILLTLVCKEWRKKKMVNFNHKKVDQLIDQLLENLLDEINHEDIPNGYNLEGKTVINVHQNNNGLILLLLYLLNHYKLDRFVPDSSQKAHPSSSHSKDKEIEDLIKIVDRLQLKNKTFQSEVSELTGDLEDE